MSYPRPTRLRSALRRAGLALATLVVALCGLELALRALDLRPPARPVPHGFEHRRVVDEPLGWELVPVSEARWTYPAWAGGVEREVVARVNAHGWRGAGPTGTPGALRVACAGDSFTFGTGVQDGETLPAQLADALTGRLGRPVEAFNWGVAGYDTRQEVEQLARRLPRWRPDVVVLTYFVNDAAHPQTPRPAAPAAPARLALALCGPGADSPFAPLRARSWALRWGCQALTAALLEGRQARIEEAHYAEDNPGWSEVREALRRARTLCDAQGSRLLVALYPRLQRRGDGLVTDAAYARVAAFCRSEGIEVLDLSPAIAGRPVERMWVHVLDPHPDPRAHGIAARALAERLVALGWLAPGVARAER